MGETKNCPYCGKEILESAHKCRFCEQWIDKECPNCGKWIRSSAQKCRYCGEWLNESSNLVVEKTTMSNVTPSDPMQNQVSHPYNESSPPTLVYVQNQYDSSQAKEDAWDVLEEHDERRRAGCILKLEGLAAFILAAIAGYDWIPVTIAYLVVMTLLIIWKPFRIVFCILVSAIWAFLGYALMTSVDETEYGPIIYSIIMGGTALMLHWPIVKRG